MPGGAIVVAVVVVAVFMAAMAAATMVFNLDGGGRSPHTGAVSASATATGTVIHDPWCEQSEDSCAMDYRANGSWVVTRVVP